MCFVDQFEEIRGMLAQIDSKKDEEFIREQIKRSVGDANECESASGVFTYKKGNSPQEKIRFSYLNGDPLKLVEGYIPYVDAALIAEGVSSDSRADTFEGLLINRDGHWFFVKPNLGPKQKFILPFKTEGLFQSRFKNRDRLMLQIKRATAALNNHLDEYPVNGFEVQPINFDKKMIEGRGSNGTMLSFDGRETVNDFARLNGRNIERWYDNHTTRIPPKMFELFDDAEFKKAHAEKKYSKVMDMIFAKAKDVMGPGQTKEALMVSLLFVDMRQRGPCGAVFGLRGKHGAPKSIYDGEEFSELVGNRLDAAQHFFGYSMMETLLPPGAARIGSEVGK